MPKGRYLIGWFLWTLVNVLCLQFAAGDVIIYKGDNTTEKTYSSLAIVYGDFPAFGFQGLVALANHRDACDLLDPPPHSVNASLKWFALIFDGNCVNDIKIRNVQLAGYDAAIMGVYVPPFHPVRVSASAVDNASKVEDLTIHIPLVNIDLAAAEELRDHFTYVNGYSAIIVPMQSKFVLVFTIFGSIVGTILFCAVGYQTCKCIEEGNCRNCCMRTEPRVERSNYCAQIRQKVYNCFKKLPVVKFKLGDQYRACAICQEDYLEGQRLHLLSCSHTYHVKCILPWLREDRRRCPLCQQDTDLPPESLDQDSVVSEDSVICERTPLMGAASTSPLVSTSTFASKNYLPASHNRSKIDVHNAQKDEPSYQSIGHLNTSLADVLRIQPRNGDGVPTPSTSSQQ